MITEPYVTFACILRLQASFGWGSVIILWLGLNCTFV